MYFYFYDKLTQDKKYESLLVQVETRLIDLGLNGRVEKLSIFKNAREIIRDAVKKGAKTIIAVGDDKTFTTVVNMVATHDVTMGFIPIEPGVFSRLLGIPAGEAACDVLSKRLYQTIDLGCIQDFYFVGSVGGQTTAPVTLRCDDAYTVTAPAQTQLLFSNVGNVFGKSSVVENAADGALRMRLVAPSVSAGFLRRKQPGAPETLVRARTIEVLSPNAELSLTADQNSSFHSPCTITVAPHALKVVVGRERLLAVA
jgi:diacylglycerol kinase family enzyme